ncbi:MAG TPA: polyprenyl synthetase family protein [Ignavibacteria bacterium]|nr:polyprenyl synthetase family protein [Ignavibacteria bacterium]
MIGGKNNKYYSLYERGRKKIDKKLKQSLGNREPISLYEPASYIIEGEGKRIRPLLVLFSVKAVGGNFNQAYNAAVAVELLHNFTLVHDDIMDNADKRRGRPTVHKLYNTNTAILVGDSLLSVAYELLLKDCNGNSKKIFSAFTKGLVEVCEGQSMDKDFETKNDVSINNYITMIRKKTAALSEMCCKVGAYLGNGSEAEIKALANFGRNIGMAFQIHDDLLDVSADETKFGKFVGGDLVEGKKTFLFLSALNKAEGSIKNDLLKVIERRGIKKNQIKKYKNIYIKLGVLKEARLAIKKYSKRAINSLCVLKDKNNRELFIWFANSLIYRNK